MIRLPPSIISLILAIMVGLYTARLLLSLAYMQRGYWAIGGEWLVILGVTLLAWWISWRAITAFGKERRDV